MNDMTAYYANRPKPKYHKEVSIKGQRGKVTDVMWDSKKGTWNYSIKVWLNADEKDVT